MNENKAKKMPPQTKNFRVYKASAGAGKTYTLVKEYLKLALTGKGFFSFKKILAITFTNKAAGEMKERIIENLHKISFQEDEKLIEDYCEYFDIQRNELIDRAQKVFEYILHNYSDLNVSTIDKFTHKILRAFSKDLNVPIDFDIEMDSNGFLSKIIDDIISKVGIDEDITKLLIGFIDAQSNDDKSWNISEAILDIAKSILSESNETLISKLHNHQISDFLIIIKDAESKIKEIEKRLFEIGENALKIIQENGLSSSDFAYGNSGVYNFYAQLYKKNFELKDGKRIQDAIFNDKWTTSKTSQSTIQTIDNIAPKLKDFYHEVMDKKQVYLVLSLIKGNIYSIALINEISKEIERLKEEKNIVLISDFNKIIHHEIKDQPVPFIYEKIGERFENIMIDEFQDTSVFQWQNFIPLIENSLAEGNFNLIVGDAKQAIYRFRNGEVKQFAMLPKIYQSEQNEILKEKEVTFEANYEMIPLPFNYRSKKEIIQFNNYFFNVVKHSIKPKYQYIYDDLDQQYFEHKTGGYIEIETTKYDKDNDLALPYTIEKLNQCLEDGYEYRDIAIIVRNGKDGNKIAEFLTKNQIPVISSDSLLLSSDLKVAFLISLFELTQNQQDEFTKFKVLNNALIYFQEQQKMKHYVTRIDRHNYTVELNKYFEEKEIYLSFDNIEDLYNTCEYFIQQLSLHQNMDAYLSGFMNYVHSFSEKKQSVKDFLESWNKTKEKLSIKLSSNSNAIEIITIHKSKGLQYPIVMMPYTNWPYSPIKKHNEWIEMKNEIENLPSAYVPFSKSKLESTGYIEYFEEYETTLEFDNLNLLYVAFTRAEDRIYCLSQVPYTKSNNIFCLIDTFVTSHGSDNKYTFGERQKANIKHKLNTNSCRSSAISNEWKSRIRISNQYSKIEGIGIYNKQVEIGNIVHEILSEISHPNELDNYIQSHSFTHIITPSDYEEIKQQVTNSIMLLDKNNWLHLPFKNELEIITSSGELLRPDKVLFDNDKLIIIDYKTGEKENSHTKQIMKYESEISKMGYSKIDSYLLYTKYNELVHIPSPN